MKDLDYTKLDKLLHELFVGDRKYAVQISELYSFLFSKEPDFDEDDYLIYVAELTALGLATERDSPGTIMDITPLGRQVRKAGGWLAYSTQLELKEQQERELRLKEVKASELSATASKKSMYAAYIAIFISIAVAIWQYIDGSKKQTDSDLVNKKLEVLDSLHKIQSVQLQKYQTQFDSLLKQKVLKK